MHLLFSQLVIKPAHETLTTYYANQISTPIGEVIALADNQKLYFLDFVKAPKIIDKLGHFLKKKGAEVSFEKTAPLISIENELNSYFLGKLSVFKTPLQLEGSDFQIKVWSELIKIPYAQTISYADLAHNINQPLAYRAVANANGRNKLAIIIPCHRVIESSGKLGGYSSGIKLKEYLLSLEKNCHKNC